ncbi:hypothetical protein ACIBIZ_11985 [Nonomuraea spiralis]|uniref:hypothetical protein n=1 Tax=Nonomuraea spiralis TaxID=46182 RepID=UPI00379FA61E
MNFPTDPRWTFLDNRPVSSSNVAANLNGHRRRTSTSATRASTTGADSGVAETCSFHPWSRVPVSCGAT